MSDVNRHVEARSKGFVFATTGEAYTTMARRAARTLKRAMPTARIDLFTDQTVSDDVFERVHPLGNSYFRPKMQAMRESRFERTIALDSDVVVLSDLSELFGLLDRADMAGAPGVGRFRSMIPAEPGIPRCVPVINTGVIALRASPDVHGFLQAWEDEVRRSGHEVDQPGFRKVLYQSDLRFITLGMEYNVKWLDLLEIWSDEHGAPRVLHASHLNRKAKGEPTEPFTIVEAVGKRRARQVRKLIDSDWTLGSIGLRRVPPLVDALKGKAEPTLTGDVTAKGRKLLNRAKNRFKSS